VLGALWYFCSKTFKSKKVMQNGFEQQPESTYYAWKFGEMDDVRRIILSWYYSMTTLTTVGYGDYYPRTNIEIILAIIYMLAGVVFFSYIMSSMNDIWTNQRNKI
jgi:hypothetical protein